MLECIPRIIGISLHKKSISRLASTRNEIEESSTTPFHARFSPKVFQLSLARQSRWYSTAQDTPQTVSPGLSLVLLLYLCCIQLSFQYLLELNCTSPNLVLPGRVRLARSFFHKERCIEGSRRSRRSRREGQRDKSGVNEIGMFLFGRAFSLVSAVHVMQAMSLLSLGAATREQIGCSVLSDSRFLLWTSRARLWGRRARVVRCCHRSRTPPVGPTLPCLLREHPIRDHAFHFVQCIDRVSSWTSRAAQSSVCLIKPQNISYMFCSFISFICQRTRFPSHRCLDDFWEVIPGCFLMI